jgi:hypothetical protein
MVNMQRQQEHLFDQMKLDFATKLAEQNETNMREIEALRSDLVHKGRHQKEKEFIDHTVNYIDACSRADGRVIPNPRPSRGGLGAVVDPSAAVRQRGHYDPAGENSCAPIKTAPVRDGAHGGVVQGDPLTGYLPEKVTVPMYEEAEIGHFHGGVEARAIWPGFHANFMHLAKSYHWNYHVQGVLLARKCRGLALPVMNSVPEKMRQDYKSLVTVFNKAYVPKEWARTYRGALNSRKQKQGESLLKYAAAPRELALTAFPCMELENTDQVREDHCLDQFLRGIRDSLL